MESLTNDRIFLDGYISYIIYTSYTGINSLIGRIYYHFDKGVWRSILIYRNKSEIPVWVADDDKV
jgi:hypothetical protein